MKYNMKFNFAEHQQMLLQYWALFINPIFIPLEHFFAF